MPTADRIKKPYYCATCVKFFPPGSSTHHKQENPSHDVLSPEAQVERGISAPTVQPKPSIQPKPSTSGRYQCKECDKSFSSTYGVTYHLKTTGHECLKPTTTGLTRRAVPNPHAPRYGCVDCGKTFAVGGGGRNHALSTGHNILSPVKYEAYLREKGNQNGNTSGRTITIEPVARPTEPSEVHVAYICGRFQAEIESYSQSIGVPQSAIAVRVAEFLSLSSRRGLLGAINRMPGL